MRYFSQHSYVRILGSGCAIFVLLASAYVTIHFSQARATSSLPIVNKPVIFLHGINQDGSADCSDWARAMIVLAQSTKISFTGPLVRLGYYSKDKNCSQNLSQISSPNCIGYDGTLKKAVGTTNESIRHIACELAWYLYNQYTQNGISVDMVTHSMGGLITRYALSEVEHGAKSFPSMLYVSNVIDLDTPNGGLPVDWYDKGIVNDVLCKNCLQAVQMQPGNPFILELYYFAQDPQIKGSVTTWTLLSSIINISCLNKRTNTVFAIPLPSPLDMNGKHIVKVVYKQPYYCHNGIFSMQEAAVPNQPTQVQYCDGCAKQDAKNWQQWKSSSTFPDPLYEMLRVLSAQASSPTPTPTPTLSPTLTPTPTLSPTLTPSPTPSSGSCPLPHPIVSSGLTVYTEGNNFLQALDANSGQLRWCYPLPVNGGSLVVANGIVYVIHNSSDSTSSILYALRAFDGLLLWNRNFSGGADNHLVVVNNVLYDGIGPSIYALNPTTGAQLWQFQTQGHSALDVTVANGVAYADVWGQYTSSNNYVYALNANDGSLLWSNNIGIMSPRILAITPSVIYINTSDYNSGSLDAMSTTSGKMIWTNPNSGGDTVINGVIYGGGNNGISALDATNGSTLWQTQQSDFTHLWVSNGVIYGVAQPGNSSTTTSVFTLNATNGAVLWQTPLNFYSFPSQIEVVNGIVYINDTGATMYALQAATGAVLWKTQVPPYISQDFVVTNGLVYVGSLDTGYVTALNASNGSLAWQYQGGTGVGAVG